MKFCTYSSINYIKLSLFGQFIACQMQNKERKTSVGFLEFLSSAVIPAKLVHGDIN